MFTLKVCDVSDVSGLAIYLLRRLAADDNRAACRCIITMETSIEEEERFTPSAYPATATAEEVSY